MLTGAYWLPPARGVPGLPPEARRWVDTVARQVADAGLRAADLPPGGVDVRLAPLPAATSSDTTPGASSLLVDLEVWLHALASDLATATGADRAAAAGDPGPVRRSCAGAPDAPVD
ncbi:MULTISPECIES: hypothetical protein [unclassified Streptomyces]|uniref:hypothetical protein n=1 Tax=unclassified Streptomyces TaxID=2593676 RepID=UPI00211C4C68|nr:MULTISPECIES: hypothetical protein [unclassified Streptomyces]MDN3250105.1 hypothetical protein [Streptomyces sp. ZSW22]MDN3257697.1 hypothetical protein [Streptomyces sp. MA25(2023)]